MIGTVLVYIAFATSLISTLLFFISSSGKKDFSKLARLFYHLASLSVIFTSAYLLSIILSHDFRFAYVWEYSNRDLGTPLLISTFFAGQEGSFLLWSLFTVVIGLFLLSYLTKFKDFESPVMGMFTLVITFLTLLLIFKSPFTYVWEKFQNTRIGFTPEDGRGLNPILQNFWMVIHPPILFIGFAAMTVPFAFAIGALINRKFNDWINYAMPWLLFATGILGLGIILGGYWAYGVLGWGGYWAWDPVENSSLIPWIIGVAAIHIMIAQRTNGGYKKTNLILNILAFLFVLYSTFLTRSGVLQNASVHSFVEPGAVVYWVLVVFILSFLVISIVALLKRWSLLTKEKSSEQIKMTSREAWLYIGSLLLLASSAIIIAGTSLPLFSKSTVDANFYNNMNIPIAILISVFAGLTFYLDWKSTEKSKIFNRVIYPIVLSIVTSIILAVIGIRDVVYIVFAFAALFTFFSSIDKIIKNVSKKKYSFGAALSHIGIALFFLGVIGSARYSEEVQVSLAQNIPVEAFGYKFTYTGAEAFTDPQNKADEKYNFNVSVEKDNKEMILKPVMYVSSFMDGNIIKNPDIANFVTKDIYLAPLELLAAEQFSKNETYSFNKGEEKQINDLKVKFVDFDLTGMQPGQNKMNNNSSLIKSIITVQNKNRIDTLVLSLNYIDGVPAPDPVLLKSDTTVVFYFANMKMKGQDSSETSKSEIAVVDYKKKKLETPKPETLVATIAIKPFIGILWTGSFIMVIGFMYAIIKRVKKAKSSSIK